jgi:hypothetical protein
MVLPLSPPGRTAAFTAVLACSLVPAVAHARGEDRENEQHFAFGAVPSARVGKASASLSDPSGGSPGQSGWALEFDLTGLMVLPGDVFAVGVSGAYTMADLSRDDGSVGSDLGYDGWSLSPVVMAGFWRVFVRGYVGYMSASLSPGDSSAHADAFRYGGGLSFVAYRNAGADIALTFDVTGLQASGVDLGGGIKSDFSATNLLFGITTAFQPEFLAL